MPYVTLTYNNAYNVKPMSDEDADKLMQQGHDLVFVDDAVLAAWTTHCNTSAAFNTMWRALESKLPRRRRVGPETVRVPHIFSDVPKRPNYKNPLRSSSVEITRCHGCGNTYADHPNETGCQFWHDKAE